MRNLLLLATIILLAAGPVHAQKKVRNNLELRPEVQLEYALKSGDYAFISARGLRETTGTVTGTASTFYNKQLAVGYEHFWNSQWSVGGTMRYERTLDKGSLTPEVLLRHRGELGGLTVGQRLSAEFKVADWENSRGSARLRLDAERVIRLGRTVRLRPRLAYEMQAYLRLQREDDEPKERFIDFGLLRGEMGLRFTDWLDLTPWAGYSSSYLFVLDQTDEEGNPIPGGARNFRTPVLGVDLRFTLFQGGSIFERRQLPTQH